LELPYILQNVGEGSRRMKLLLDASGSKEVRILLELKAYKFLSKKIAS
jgi:anaphase-promoting complex subunit 7